MLVFRREGDVSLKETEEEFEPRCSSIAVIALVLRKVHSRYILAPFLCVRFNVGHQHGHQGAIGVLDFSIGLKLVRCSDCVANMQ